jgi:hypothetical protein
MLVRTARKSWFFAITGGRLYEQVRIQQEWQDFRMS